LRPEKLFLWCCGDATVDDEVNPSGQSCRRGQLSRVIFGARERGSVMGDFLTGARWGAWFVLAGITAAGLWAIVH